MTATHAQYTRQSQSIANSLWEARIVRNCSGNPLQFLRFEGTDAWHGCGITPSKSLGEVKETLIVPSVQVKYGERCLAFSSDTSRLDFRSCELPYTAFVWNGSKLIYSISTRRWCLSLLNSSWPNSGSCTRYGQAGGGGGGGGGGWRSNIAATACDYQSTLAYPSQPSNFSNNVPRICALRLLISD